MAGFNVNDTSNYGGQGGGGFFSLRNNKDTAVVRLLYNGIEDATGYAVHEVELNGKKRYVNCLRDYGDPIDACPFCKAHMFVQVKFFVPVYVMSLKTNNENPTKNPPVVAEVNALQTWERGKTFSSKLSSICSRYPDTVSHIFEIERNGRAGDTKTTYEIFETGVTPDVTMEQFEVPSPLGTIILDKTADEMEDYLRTGKFSDSNSAPNNNYGNSYGNTQSSGGYVRRTPASGDGRREVI